jgi:hypothetical protein
MQQTSSSTREVGNPPTAQAANSALRFPWKRLTFTIIVPDFGPAALWPWPYLVAAILVVPSALWIWRDHTIWPWDQAWYGEVSVDLWYAWQQSAEILAELTLIRPQRDFRLLVAGDGSDGALLRKKAERAGLSSLIDFLGHVGDPAPIIRSADVLILTSRNEGIPLVVLEGMACGKPVVSSNAGAITEAVLEGKTGTLIEIGPGEARQFAAAIHQLLEMPALRREMGNHARSHVESRHSLEDALACYRELFTHQPNERSG